VVTRRDARSSSRQLRPSWTNRIQISFSAANFFFGKKPQVLLNNIPALKEMDIRVLVYLRRQDHFLESLYAQLAKFRLIGSVEEFLRDRNHAAPNYLKILDTWKLAASQVIPVVFEGELLIGNDLIQDFMTRIGHANIMADMKIAKRANRSVNALRLQILQEFFRAGFSQVPRSERSKLEAVLDETSHEPAPRMRREDREKVLENASAINKAICQQYLPLQDQLLSSDLTADPSKQATGELSDEQLAELRHVIALIKNG
jgi:hypothetical protein